MLCRLLIASAIAAFAPYGAAKQASSFYYSGDFLIGSIAEQSLFWSRYSLGGGYFLNDHIAVGASINATDIEGRDARLSAAAYLRGQRVLNSTTDAYLDMGLDTYSIEPFARVGALFEVIPRMHLNIGYAAQMFRSEVGQSVSIGLHYKIPASYHEPIEQKFAPIDKTLHSSQESAQPHYFDYCFSMKQITYKVERGDSVSDIRSRFNLTRADFTSANPKIERRATPDLLFTGETLIIPQIEIQRCH